MLISAPKYSCSEYPNSFSAWSISPCVEDPFFVIRDINSLIMADAAVALSEFLSDQSRVIHLDHSNDQFSSTFATQVGSNFYNDKKSEVFSEINRLTHLPPGWDGGEDDVAPSATAASDAINFYQKTPPTLPAPEVFASSDGELGFLWADPETYLNVSFFGGGRMAFYGYDHFGTVKGDLVISIGHSLPEALAKFLVRHS